MKKGTVLITIGLLLIAAALCLTVYNILDCSRAAKATDTILTELMSKIDPEPVPIPDAHLTAEESENVEYPDYVLDPDMDMPTETIEGRDYVGVLRIPALDLELSVISEWNYTNLTISPCLYSGTAYKGNFVICAHNYPAHFGQINQLGIGDKVIFTDMAGNVFTYRVIEVETLMPTDVEQMVIDEYDMTLFTCTIGGRSRVTVRCEKVNDEIDASQTTP